MVIQVTERNVFADHIPAAIGAYRPSLLIDTNLRFEGESFEKALG